KSLAAGSKGLRINIPEIELIGKDWKRLAAGKMNREEAAAFKRTFIKVYNQVVTGLGGQAVPDESTESQTKTPANTPAGTVTSSSVPGGGGGLPKSGTTSGGIQYRVLPRSMPTVELTINGQTKRVEVGDGATPADIDEIAKRLSGGGAPTPAPAPRTA